MKNITMIIWLMQLGFSIAVPPAGFIMLAVWLRDHFGLGQWVLWLGILFGVTGAIDGLRSSLKAMERLSRDDPDKEPPPVSFNDHD